MLVEKNQTYVNDNDDQKDKVSDFTLYSHE